MKPDKVLSMLGIAAKSGSVVSGEFSTEKAVKEGRSISGDRGVGRFRQYAEDVFQYDKILWSADVPVRR